MRTTEAKKLRFVVKCTCGYERENDNVPLTTAGHDFLIGLGFTLIDGVYVDVQKIDCGHSKVKP
jgi:hypothetical protein